MTTQTIKRSKRVRECRCHCHCTTSQPFCNKGECGVACEHCIPTVSSKHKHPLQGKTLREQVEEIVGHDWDCPVRRAKGCTCGFERTINELMQVFQEAIISCKPWLVPDTEGENRGYNKAIKDMEANIQTLLDDTDDKQKG